jgi:uncharacterized membrane protein
MISNEIKMMVGAVLLVVSFFVFSWAMSFACVAVGHGPEVCGW